MAEKEGSSRKRYPVDTATSTRTIMQIDSLPENAWRIFQENTSQWSKTILKIIEKTRGKSESEIAEEIVHKSVWAAVKQ